MPVPPKAKPTQAPQTGAKSEREFLDPRREWGRLFSECWGTFLLVLVAAIGVVFEWILKGPPTAAGTLAAQGDSEPKDG